MSPRLRHFALVFALGLICGGGGVELYHRSHDEQAMFDQKMRCRALAEEYVKKRTDSGIGAALQRDDYSPARNSCIAEETDEIVGTGQIIWSFAIVDVVTGQQLFFTSCHEIIGDCSNQATAARDKAFEAALRTEGTKN